MEATFCNTPLGTLELKANNNGLNSVRFLGEGVSHSSPAPAMSVLDEATKQLKAYFKGDLTTFDLPLAPQGTAFQQRVWEELQKSPYGSTTTYRDLAEKLGDPKVIRAAGRANGMNPIAIIIPCHRVIGSDNKLVGYAGGIERKRRLLQHEGALLL